MSNESVDDVGMQYLCPSSDFVTIDGAIFILIFIISVTGNALLLCVIFIYEKLKNVTNLFILNLACSDLVFTITLPFWAIYHLHHWIFGDFACKFVTAAYFVGIYSSVILLTAITVDRFITVVLHNWPSTKVRRRSCAMAACAATWLISIAASISDAIEAKVETHWDNITLCEGIPNESDVSLGYYLQVLLLFVLPFAIIVFCYSAILRTVLRSSNRKKFRTVVVVFCIVTAFFICWGPYNIVLFINSMYKPIDCYAKDSLYITYSIFRLLAYSHCCMNPLLYMLSQKMRGHLWKLIHYKNTKRKDKERGTGQSTVIQNVAFEAQNSAVMWDTTSK